MTEHNIYLPLIAKLFEKDIPAAANLLENLKESEATSVLQSLPTVLALRIIKNLQISFVAVILGHAGDAFLMTFSAQLEPEFVTSVLMHSSSESREWIRAFLPKKTEVKIRDLLAYPEESVGRIMTSEFLSFNKDITARETINRIRALAKKRFPSSYAYVVDNDSRLVGVLNIRDLMLASPLQWWRDKAGRCPIPGGCHEGDRDAGNTQG